MGCEICLSLIPSDGTDKFEGIGVCIRCWKNMHKVLPDLLN